MHILCCMCNAYSFNVCNLPETIRKFWGEPSNPNDPGPVMSANTFTMANNPLIIP